MAQIGRQAIGMAAIGMVVGGAAAGAMSRGLVALRFEISPLDGGIAPARALQSP